MLGKATLASVSIAITDKPQIMVADIQEIIVPEAEILPGEDLTVSVVLLPHWSAAGEKRTMQREVTLEIPEDFPAGDALLTVSADGGFSGFEPFFGPDPFEFEEPDFEFEEPEEELLPENLDELIKEMEAGQIDPGLNHNNTYGIATRRLPV